MEEGDPPERNGEAQGVRLCVGQAEFLKRAVEPFCDGGFAVHAKADAGGGYAQLGDGDIGVLAGVAIEDAEQPSGRAITLLGHDLESAAAGADQGEFGRDEDAVDRDEQQDGEDRKEDVGHAGSPSGVRSIRTRRTAWPSMASTTRSNG